MIDILRTGRQAWSPCEEQDIVWVCLFLAASALAQSVPDYFPSEAAKHVGETAAVEGVVDGFHESSKHNIFLNTGGRYPNQAFAAYIPTGSAGLLPVEHHCEGKRITVTGKILFYEANRKLL